MRASWKSLALPGSLTITRVVRPALVVVSSGPEQQEPAGVSERGEEAEAATEVGETAALADKDQQEGSTVIIDRTFQDVYKSISTKGRKTSARRRKVNPGSSKTRECAAVPRSFR